MKRTATIQDISCFGRCSLTAALPVISAMGVETAIIPTAVLSTHTGGFKGFTFCDLTDQIKPIYDHWKQLGLEFDSIYTGYLGSDEQIALVCEFIDIFGKNALKFIDPVMADNGKLYTGFGDDFPAKMAKLCAKADVIVPNLTEAACLVGEKYPGDEYDEKHIRELLKRLCSLGSKSAVVTGVIYDNNHHGAVAYDSVSGEYCEYFAEHIDTSFHGTGDVFSSSLCGALTLGKSMYDSLRIAVDFTVSAIRDTRPEKDKYWYGVNFEQRLGDLAASCKG